MKLEAKFSENTSIIKVNAREVLEIRGEDGKSAYEIAVDHGFEGSEAEWLESLQGVDGVNGADGYTPVKGVDYVDGVDGKDGADGNPGTDGYTPVRGTDYWTDADKDEIVSEVVETITNDNDILKLTEAEVEALRELIMPYTLECSPVMTLSRSSGSANGAPWYRVSITVTGISKSLIQKLEATYGTANPSDTSQISYGSFKEVTGTYNDSTERYTATYTVNYSGRYFTGFKVRLTYTHPVEGTKTLERTV